MPRGEERARSARVWEADLSEGGRKLTLAELAALEAMHHCQLLARIATAIEDMGKHVASLEGRFDRLEQFLGAADARYPRGGRALPALPHVGDEDAT